MLHSPFFIFYYIKIMEEQIDTLQFLNDPELVKEINRLMNPVITRSLSEEDKALNRRFRRGPEDYFLENNTFTGTHFVNHFKLIVERKSTLSRSCRDCVKTYVITAMHNLYLKSQMKEENGNQEESRS